MITQAGLLEMVKEGSLEKVHDELNKTTVSSDDLHSALFWAIRLGHSDIVELFLDHGADVNYHDFSGLSPLIWAAIYTPDLNVIDILLQRGADVNHASTKRRQTTLHAAAIRGQAEVVSKLLIHNADPNPFDYLHKTPLLHATCKGHTDCVKVLLQYNCEVDVAGVIQGVAMTPLLCALINNNLDIVKMLFLAGAHFVKSAIYQTFTLEKFYETVEESLNLSIRPVFLQQQCRNRLREVLRPDFIHRLHGLSGILPQPMHGYLSLSEFDD